MKHRRTPRTALLFLSLLEEPQEPLLKNGSFQEFQKEALFFGVLQEEPFVQRKEKPPLEKKWCRSKKREEKKRKEKKRKEAPDLSKMNKYRC